jgi:hypothetical protein
MRQLVERLTPGFDNDDGKLFWQPRGLRFLEKPGFLGLTSLTLANQARLFFASRKSGRILSESHCELTSMCALPGSNDDGKTDAFCVSE